MNPSSLHEENIRPNHFTQHHAGCNRIVFIPKQNARILRACRSEIDPAVLNGVTGGINDEAYSEAEQSG